MMGFIARPESYRREKLNAEFDVPNGIIEDIYSDLVNTCIITKILWIQSKSVGTT